MSPTTLGLIIGLALAIVVVILILLGRERTMPPIEEPPKETSQTPIASQQPIPVTGTLVADDLTIIEGIGPKIASILKQNGIENFDQLASTDPGKLERILRENGLRFIIPDSWPKQARLAADGKMDELKDLQAHLTAGR